MPRASGGAKRRRCCTRVSRNWPGNTASCGRFCRALEQCEALLGEVEAEFADFSRLLRLLLSQYSVGTIPPPWTG